MLSKEIFDRKWDRRNYQKKFWTQKGTEEAIKKILAEKGTSLVINSQQVERKSVKISNGRVFFNHY
jgi:hypothetical protein